MREDGGSSGELTRALREHPVEGSVVYGGITEIAERPYGSLTLELTGSEEEIAAFIADLSRSTSVLDLGTAEAPRQDPDAVGPRASGTSADDGAARDGADDGASGVRDAAANEALLLGKGGFGAALAAVFGRRRKW